MAIIALVVAVLLNTALAVVGFVFYRRLLHSLNNVAQVAGMRYMVPDEPSGPSIFKAIIPPASVQDVAGAWAEEQERRGVNVSDEDIEIQRRMWAAEGQA